MNIAFPPPQRWQDFEELTVQVARAVFDDPGAQGHGRAGQAQSGVDVHATEPGSGRLVGIQCKRRGDSNAPSASLSDQDVREEVRKADGFKPKLDYFIIATTGSRDTGFQADLRYLQQERSRDGKFAVAAWYWEDYLGFLNNDSRISGWYSRLLQDLYGDGLSDRQILSVVRTAFSRAAFRTPLHLESPGEFRQALLDTERAVNTGLLLDRETRMPLCRAPGGLIDLRQDGKRVARRVGQAVQKARQALDSGIADGRIRASGFCLIFQDVDVRHTIDSHRADAIRSLNELLGQHGETLVESPLLDESWPEDRGY